VGVFFLRKTHKVPEVTSREFEMSDPGTPSSKSGRRLAMPARIIDRRKIGMKPNRGTFVDAAMRRMVCTFPSLSEHRRFVTSTLVHRVSEVAIPSDIRSAAFASGSRLVSMKELHDLIAAFGDDRRD
jgi:hypothetical protein